MPKVKPNEEDQISKLKAAVPQAIHNFIAQATSNRDKYEDPVRVIDTQVRDPMTGVMRGDKIPELHNVQMGEGQLEEVEGTDCLSLLSTDGMDPKSEDGQLILNVVNKGQGKGKPCKGQGNGNRFKRGKPGHFARECPGRDGAAIQAFQGAFKGKTGKGKGK